MHHHWAVEVSRGSKHTAFKLACSAPSSVRSCPPPPVFVQVVSPPLGWSPLSSFIVVWYPRCGTRRPNVVFQAVDVPYIGPLRIISMSFVLSLINMLIILSLYVMLRKHIFILARAAASLFCADLASVRVSARHVS